MWILPLDMIAGWVREWAEEGHLSSHLTFQAVANIQTKLRGESETFFPCILRHDSKEKFPWLPVACRLTAKAFFEHKIAQLYLLRPFHFLAMSASGELVGMETTWTKFRDHMKGKQASRHNIDGSMVKLTRCCWTDWTRAVEWSHAADPVRLILIRRTHR